MPPGREQNEVRGSRIEAHMTIYGNKRSRAESRIRTHEGDTMPLERMNRCCVVSKKVYL